MGMGAAYAAGAGAGRSRSEGYAPLISSLNKGGASSRDVAAGMALTREAGLKERAYEDAKDRQWERDAEYSRLHGGKMVPTDASATLQSNEAEAERERQLKLEMQGNTLGMDKERLTEEGRQFDVGTEQKGKQFDTTAGMAKERLGLDKNKDTREQGTYDLKMKQEKDTQNYQKMMQSFMGGDYDSVMAWFARNAPQRKDGSRIFPTIEQGRNQGEILITPPGSDKAESMSVDDFGKKVLWKMNPAYEYPKGAKEEADISATGRKGGFTADQLEKNAINFAKGIADNGGDYNAAYQQYKVEHSGGGMTPRPGEAAGQGGAPTGKKVVKQRLDRKKMRVEFTNSDGSYGYRKATDADIQAADSARAKIAPDTMGVSHRPIGETPEQTIPDAPPGTSPLSATEEPTENEKQVSELGGKFQNSPVARGFNRFRNEFIPSYRQ